MIFREKISSFNKTNGPKTIINLKVHPQRCRPSDKDPKCSTNALAKRMTLGGSATGTAGIGTTEVRLACEWWWSAHLGGEYSSLCDRCEYMTYTCVYRHVNIIYSNIHIYMIFTAYIVLNRLRWSESSGHPTTRIAVTTSMTSHFQSMDLMASLPPNAPVRNKGLKRSY